MLYLTIALNTSFRYKYIVLMANKGNPNDMVRWIPGLGTSLVTFKAGTDDRGFIKGPDLYICLSANAQFTGKAGIFLANGCHSYIGNDNGTSSENLNFEVLGLK